METKPSAQPLFKKFEFGNSNQKSRKMNIYLFFPVQYSWSSISCSKYFVWDCGYEKMELMNELNESIEESIKTSDIIGKIETLQQENEGL